MYKVTTKIQVKIFLPESLYTTQNPPNHIYFLCKFESRICLVWFEEEDLVTGEKPTVLPGG